MVRAERSGSDKFDVVSVYQAVKLGYLKDFLALKRRQYGWQGAGSHAFARAGRAV
jgi:hypothetical protein